jgi:LacI family transcriptional regulator
MTVKQLPPTSEGRGYAWLAGRLKARIAAGEIPAGLRLPTVRELGAEHGVSRETARRAVKELQAEGLVASEPRHGCRVQARANDPDRGLPVAFVVSAAEEPGLWNEFHRLLFAGLQSAAEERGWSVLAVGAGRRPAREVMEQLRDCRACGMVLDTANPELLGAVRKMSLPAVMMDAWEPEMPLDAVVQDSFQGALVATQYLVSRGHQRIGWLGRIADSAQGQERFGGVAAGIAAAGLVASREFMLDTPGPKVAAAARRLLARRNRPTGVLGLWHDAASELVRAARELRLKPGRDVEIVGWTAQEQYEGAYRMLFNGAELPATMVWSIAELARMTVARLAERRAKPAMPPALIKVPARLRLPEGAPGTEGGK